MFERFFKSLVTHMVAMDWLLSLAFVVLLAFSLIGLSHGISPMFSAWNMYLWFGSIVLLAIYGTTVGIRLAQSEKLAYLSALVILIVLYMIICSTIALSVGGYEKHMRRPFDLAAIVLVGYGWFVTFRISSRQQRKQHTFNVLTQSRFSTAFVSQVQATELVYPYPKSVELDAFDLLKNPPSESDAENYVKYKAICGVKYLLNYYEFVCAAIEAKDIDEDLVYCTIGQQMVSFFNRSMLVIREQRKAQPMVCVNIEIVATRFAKRDDWVPDRRV